MESSRLQELKNLWDKTSEEDKPEVFVKFIPDLFKFIDYLREGIRLALNQIKNEDEQIENGNICSAINYHDAAIDILREILRGEQYNKDIYSNRWEGYLDYI